MTQAHQTRHAGAGRHPRLAFLALAATLALAPTAHAQALHPERIILLMRHGVRPPTHEPALAPAIAPSPWPTWEVKDGYLTPHGAAAISLLAAYDRTIWSPAPAGPAITIYADVDERTVKTGEAYAAGFAPHCPVTVTHAATATDPLFSPLDNGAPTFDAKAAKAEMKPAAAAALAQAQPLLAEMQNILAPGGTAFLALPTKISAKAPGRIPRLSGPLAEGSSAAEDFLLEYLDDKPLADVAWGRATPAETMRLLALHPLAYTITARPPLIAQATATRLAHRILTALTTSGGPNIQILVGHDTNIADLAGLLNLHWSLGGYPADDPPPGGGLVFTLLADSSGHQFVQIAYQVQTPDQIRNLTPLSAAAPPATQSLTIPGCPAAACPIELFTHLIPN